MKNIKKVVLISIVVIVISCPLCLLLAPFVGDIHNFERNIYAWLVSQTLPDPIVLQVDLSRRTVLHVYPNAEDFLWLGTTWTDDGKYIEVHNSRSQVYADKIMKINPAKPVYDENIQSTESDNIFGLTNELPFILEDGESLWAACQDKNLFFTAKYIEDNLWETRLWDGGKLIKTFPPVEFWFGLYQSGFRDEPVGVTVEFSSFSPDCRYFTMDSYKDTWLLDTIDQSFAPLVISGIKLPFDQVFASLDMRCSQCIGPVWSPNSHEFAFSSNGGIEKYDMVSGQRSWLVAPDNNVRAVEWSKTGNWILGYYDQKMSLISPDGSKIGILEDCENMEHPSWSSAHIQTYTESSAWSPTEDRLAFICHQYDQSTCVDGQCEKEEDFLIIWDLTNLDNE